MSRFIVFEGIDGSGKSTQARKLVETLRSDLNMPVLLTAEPTRTQIGALIRQSITVQAYEGEEPVDDFALALLFQGDRAYHLTREIRPALKHKITVVCDRYVLSSLAYQTTERLAMERVLDLNKHFPRPDMTFYLDVSVAEALRRISDRDREKDFFEEESRLRAIRHRYEKAIELVGDAHHVKWIGGESDENEVAHQILSHIYP